MRKRRRYLGGSVFDALRWRFRDNGVNGAGGGPSGSAANLAAQPDVPPVNGGPESSFEDLITATVDELVEQPAAAAASGANAAPAARVPADPNQRAGAAQTQAQPATQWQSIREAALAQNFRFPAHIADDRGALNYLLSAVQQSQDAARNSQLATQLAPVVPQLQQFLSGQQQQTATPQRQPWEAPQYDPRWAGLVEIDERTGLAYAKPGVPPEIATRVNEYIEWRRGFDANPSAVLNGMVESRAKEIASQTVREQLAIQSRDAEVAAIVQANAPWMYVVENGQRVRDYTGRELLTPLGAAYLQKLQLVRDMGVTGPRHQDMLARSLVQLDLGQNQQQAAAAANGQASNPQTQQAAHRPNRNAAQAQPPSQRRAAPVADEPDEAGLTLAQRMMRDIRAEGITDDDIMNSMENGS